MSLVSSTREMKRLYKKCLRLIQEMELVARGFTLYVFLLSILEYNTNLRGYLDFKN